jgi:hypothetical protein
LSKSIVPGTGHATPLGYAASPFTAAAFTAATDLSLEAVLACGTWLIDPCGEHPAPTANAQNNAGKKNARFMPSDESISSRPFRAVRNEEASALRGR